MYAKQHISENQLYPWILRSIIQRVDDFAIYRTAENGQRTAANGQRTADSGKRTAENGQRTAANGQRTADSGKRTADSGQQISSYIFFHAEAQRGAEFFGFCPI